jgi:hypothetical protein
LELSKLLKPVKLASIRLNATSTWTIFTTSVFNIGNRQIIWQSFDDDYSAAGGTLYLDEVFLGTAGGTNRVSNSSFELGVSGWSITSPEIFSIQQNP